MRVNRVFHMVLFIAFFGSILVSFRFEKTAGMRAQEENLLYIPKGKYLQKIVLGYPQLVADFFWFKTISYFGHHALTDRKYPWLGNLLEAIVTLDPLWTFPFHFAGVVMGIESNLVDQSNRIVKMGIENHPNVWQFPFYIGFNYYHVKNNSFCGARYIFRASTIQGSPPYLKPLAIRLSAQGNSRENHMMMCNELLRMTRDQSIQDLIKERCRMKLSQLEPTQVEEACE